MIRIKFNNRTDGTTFVSKIIANDKYYMVLDLMGWEVNDFLIAARRGNTKEKAKAIILNCIEESKVSNYKVVECN